MKKIEDYIQGLDSMPSSEELEGSREALQQDLAKLYPNGYATLYRGFSSPSSKENLSEIFLTPDALISFSESKETAIAIAEDRAEDLNEYGYAIEIKIPIKKIFFHYQLSKLGQEHPMEKEVIINPYSYDWEIFHYIKKLS